MPDLPQSLADLLSALADNTTGDITPAVVRSALVSCLSTGNAYAQSVGWNSVEDAFALPTVIALGDMSELGSPQLPLTHDVNDHYWVVPAAGVYAGEAYFEKLKIEVGTTGRTPTHLLLGFQVDNDDFWYERHELTLDGGRYVARNVRFSGVMLATDAGGDSGKIRLKVKVDETGGTDPITLTPEGVARAMIVRVE